MYVFIMQCNIDIYFKLAIQYQIMKYLIAPGESTPILGYSREVLQ